MKHRGHGRFPHSSCSCWRSYAPRLAKRLRSVDAAGIEPAASVVSGQRSPNELRIQKVEPQGLEPWFPECHSGVLPLDDGPKPGTPTVCRRPLHVFHTWWIRSAPCWNRTNVPRASTECTATVLTEQSREFHPAFVQSLLVERDVPVGDRQSDHCVADRAEHRRALFSAPLQLCCHFLILLAVFCSHALSPPSLWSWHGWFSLLHGVPPG